MCAEKRRIIAFLFFNFNEISKMLQSKKELSSSEVLSKLMSYCAYQERCTSEVNKKLDEYVLTQNQKEKILDYLIDENYLNEQRFTETFAGGKFRVKKWGKYKIKQELFNKRVPSSYVDIALKQISEKDYINTCKELFIKKRKEFGKILSLEDKAKIKRFLTQKGYEFEVIDEVMG